ncbi:Myb-like protein [Phytophthora palmivora]|uniref:Myb-like protein n=1 Tax=Phytophthora palmivora TaxID=4796 RepID=A0A2P4X9J6_9STRA|nr:Myb-like protein [Phytophthora palmivora]
MTISSVVQNGFFQDGNQLIRIPPRSAEKVTAARRRARLAREKSKKRMNDRSRLLWTSEEHERFLEALEMYPSGPWKIIANHVGTRSTRQAMTHAQKYRQKIERRKQKQLKLSTNATACMAQLDALFPCSPTTVDSNFAIPVEQPVVNESTDIDDVERALTMEFLDEFQPLTMDSEEPLSGLEGFSSDDPFWLDIGAISASIATSTTASEPAVWDCEVLSL